MGINRIEDGQSVVIDSIVKSNQQAFYNYVSGVPSGGIKQINLPDSALRSLLIPRRVFELSTDSKRIRLVTWTIDSDWAHVLIVEQKQKPVSNIESLSMHLNDPALITGRGLAREDGCFTADVEDYLPPLPAGVDVFHRRYSNLMVGQILTPHDYVMMDVSLGIFPDGQLHVFNYWDRPELRGKGIGTAFYQNLRKSKELGFRFITGNNRKTNKRLYGESLEQNLTFYTGVLGRVPLSRIKPEYRLRFNAEESDPEEFTIDFLYESDREMMVEK